MLQRDQPDKVLLAHARVAYADSVSTNRTAQLRKKKKKCLAAMEPEGTCFPLGTPVPTLTSTGLNTVPKIPPLQRAYKTVLATVEARNWAERQKCV